MTVIKWKVGTNRLPLVWLFPFRGIHYALSSPALVQLLLLLEGERQTRSALRVSHIVQVQNTVTNCITHCLWLHLFLSHFSSLMSSSSRAPSMSISQGAYLNACMCISVYFAWGNQLSAEIPFNQANWESRKLIYLSDVTHDIMVPGDMERNKGIKEFHKPRLSSAS